MKNASTVKKILGFPIILYHKGCNTESILEKWMWYNILLGIVIPTYIGVVFILCVAFYMIFASVFHHLLSWLEYSV